MSRSNAAAGFAALLFLLAASAAQAQAQGPAINPQPAPDKPLAPAISVVRPDEPPGRCTEGRSASGRCVNPALALGGRDRGIIFTQARLSFLAPPRVLPSATITSDRVFRAPNNPITDADVEVMRLLTTTRR